MPELEPGEKDKFGNIKQGDTVTVNGETHTVQGIDSFGHHIRYHSTYNGGYHNYCFLSSWRKWQGKKLQRGQWV